MKSPFRHVSPGRKRRSRRPLKVHSADLCLGAARGRSEGFRQSYRRQTALLFCFGRLLEFSFGVLFFPCIFLFFGILSFLSEFCVFPCFSLVIVVVVRFLLSFLSSSSSSSSFSTFAVFPLLSSFPLPPAAVSSFSSSFYLLPFANNCFLISSLLVFFSLAFPFFQYDLNIILLLI